MNHSELTNKFKTNCISSYPSLEHFDFNLLNNLISTFEVQIKSKTYNQIKQFIELIYKISRTNNYQHHILKYFPELSNLLKADNNSLFMSYDFHIDDNDNARLIEINTNASCYLVGNEIYKLYENKEFINELKSDFNSEFLFSPKPIKFIAIIDEAPKNQYMYIEFLMTRDLLKSMGYQCEIYDYKDLKLVNGQLLSPNGQNIDFIYNRYCDFYLSDKSSSDLLKSYQEKYCLLSPNPKEYILLADKNRMIEWSQEEWLQSINLSPDELKLLNQTIIKSTPINKFNSEHLWANKKKYFFKPTHSFGGKSVYKGKSISKKVFQRLLNSNTLVQDFIPAPKINIEDIQWKFDLRVFAYQSKIRFSVARCYQGQVTNMKTLGGGVSRIKIVN